MTICNMSIEGGARAGLIAPDDTTFEYLARPPPRAAGRRVGRRGRPLADAAHRRRRASSTSRSRIDANALEPMVTYGTNPGMGIPITSRVPSPADQADPAQRARSSTRSSTWTSQPGQAILGQKVDVVFVGSCTNGRISDLRLAAAVLKDRHVADGVRLMVVPGSRRGEARGRGEGLVEIFKAAGAEWREAGCSMCIAMNGDQLQPGQYAVSTSNRNFEGRQGKGGRTFLASPLTAAACADQRRRDRSADAARHRDAGRGRGPLTMAEPFTMFTQQGRPARRRERRHRPDRPGALPQGHRQGRARRGALPRLAVRGGRLAQGPAASCSTSPRWPGRADPAGRRQLRRRLVARARAVGADRLGHPRDHLDVASPTSSAATASRTACCRSSSTPRPTSGCASSSRTTRTPS